MISERRIEMTHERGPSQRPLVATVRTANDTVVCDLGGTCPMRKLTPKEARAIAEALNNAARDAETLRD